MSHKELKNLAIPKSYEKTLTTDSNVKGVAGRIPQHTPAFILQ